MSGCKWSLNCSCNGGNCITSTNYAKILTAVCSTIGALLLAIYLWKQYRAKRRLEENTYSPTHTQDQMTFPVQLKNEPEYDVGAGTSSPDKGTAQGFYSC